MFVIPLGRIKVAEGIRIRRDVSEVEKLAAKVSTAIPTADKATCALVKAYNKSSLSAFHTWFYSEEHDADALWPETYDRTPTEPLPPSVRHILEHPNPLLLRPACVRLVVRCLLSLGWHPRHIAGLVRSKYERDYNWGDQWDGYDPATRADFFCEDFRRGVCHRP